MFQAYLQSLAVQRKSTLREGTIAPLQKSLDQGWVRMAAVFLLAFSLSVTFSWQLPSLTAIFGSSWMVVKAIRGIEAGTLGNY